MSLHSPSHPINRFAAIAITIWLVAFMVALKLDLRVAQWVSAHHPIDKRSHAMVILKLPGVYWTTLAIAALLFVFHPQRLRAAALLLSGGGIGGLAYQIMKWIAGRRRPVVVIEPFHFAPFIGGFKGFFHQSGLSFPSGHACLSFATAMSLTILIPRWRPLWFLIAIAVATERILENAHYVSDSIAGAGVGTLSALFALKLFGRYWPKAQTAMGGELPAGR